MREATKSRKKPKAMLEQENSQQSGANSIQPWGRDMDEWVAYSVVQLILSMASGGHS